MLIVYRRRRRRRAGIRRYLLFVSFYRPDSESRVNKRGECYTYTRITIERAYTFSERERDCCFEIVTRVYYVYVMCINNSVSESRVS